MAGLNWHYLKNESIDYYKGRGEKCVFISHQKEDSAAAGKVADYLKASGVNVYFDEYDRDLRIHRQNQDAKAVTDSIRKAITISTHMLCVVSINTLKSTWVPFEVGYGYDNTQLGILTLKGIRKDQLPEYVHSAKFIVRDIFDVNRFISRTTDTDLDLLKENKKVFSYNEAVHPLNDYLDSITF